MRRSVLVAVIAGAVLPVVGCGGPPLQFPLPDAELYVGPDQEPLKLTAEQRQQIWRILDAQFGTPDQPKVPDPIKEIPGFKTERLVEGGRAYRKLCMHCHGLDGDGDGPTAPFLNPRPRDYRPGVFKFTSTAVGAKPTWDDLHYTLVRGAPGTAMPSFRAYPEETLAALVDYVIYLSVRGQVERLLAATLTEFDELADEDIEDAITLVAGQWKAAPGAVVQPDSDKAPFTMESVKRGRELFLASDKGNCAACHGESGRGDGPSAEVDPNTGQPMRDYWGFRIRPTDLTTGLLRGGRRPIDIYRRIHTGVKGTPMPGQAGNLSSDEIWDLVNFVLYLPYQGAQARASE